MRNERLRGRFLVLAPIGRWVVSLSSVSRGRRADAAVQERAIEQDLNEGSISLGRSVRVVTGLSVSSVSFAKMGGKLRAKEEINQFARRSDGSLGPARLWQFHGGLDLGIERTHGRRRLSSRKRDFFPSPISSHPSFIVGKSRRSRQTQKSVKPVSICRGAASARLRRRPQFGLLQQQFSHHCIFSHVLSLFMVLFFQSRQRQRQRQS